MIGNEEIHDHSTRLERFRDPIVLLLNLETGAVKEIPCGPANSSHLNGDRPLVWSKHLKKAIVPDRWRRRFRLFAEFCADPEICASVDIEPARGAGYFAAYERFVAARGRGGHQRTNIPKPDLHPAHAALVKPRGIDASKAKPQTELTKQLAELERRNDRSRASEIAKLDAERAAKLEAKVAELVAAELAKSRKANKGGK